jgi:hypothetical protein
MAEDIHLPPGATSPYLKKGGKGMKRFRHVVAKIFLDKHWIEWGIEDRRGDIPLRAEDFWY